MFLLYRPTPPSSTCRENEATKSNAVSVVCMEDILLAELSCLYFASSVVRGYPPKTTVQYVP